MALIPAAAVDFIGLDQIPRDDRDAGTHSVAFGPRAPKPVANAPDSFRSRVGSARALTITASYIAVVVQIVEGRTPAAPCAPHAVTAPLRDVNERSLSLIQQEDIGRGRGGRVVVAIDVVLYVARGNEDIAVAVVVKIDQAGSPGHVGEGAGPGAGEQGHVRKQAIAQIPMERGQLFCVRRLVEIEPAVVVEVDAFDAHAGLLPPCAS